jgi:Family of unknown function (DUF6134)
MTYALCCFRFAAIGAVLLATTTARSASPASAEEVRTYEVLVKGKPAGSVVTRTASAQDGITVAITDTTVETSFLLIKYRYEYHGKETWRGDRLLRLDSRTNDNGKALAVSAAVDANGSRIEVKGKPAQSGPALAMTTNYWRLPGLQVPAEGFSIIDSDTGTLFRVRLQRVGPDEVVIGGQKIACEHYRLSGETAAELWFDGNGRLVRQQTIEQGYPTELRLVRISTPTASH